MVSPGVQSLGEACLYELDVKARKRAAITRVADIPRSVSKVWSPALNVGRGNEPVIDERDHAVVPEPRLIGPKATGKSWRCLGGMLRAEREIIEHAISPRVRLGECGCGGERQERRRDHD